MTDTCRTPGAPTPAPSNADLAALLKALGDPARLRMATMIAARPEVCVCEITPAFELSSGTVSHHLKVLREAGAVTCERRGTFVYYRATPAGARVLDAVTSAWGQNVPE